MDRAALIATYAEGPAAVAAALEGITDAELDRRPAPGEWTAREIVHHLADSETNSYIRLRRLFAEDTPAIVGYDQDGWAHELHYGRRPIGPSLAVFELYAAHAHDHAEQIRQARSG